MPLSGKHPLTHPPLPVTHLVLLLRLCLAQPPQPRRLCRRAVAVGRLGPAAVPQLLLMLEPGSHIACVIVLQAKMRGRQADSGWGAGNVNAARLPGGQALWCGRVSPGPRSTCTHPPELG